MALGGRNTQDTHDLVNLDAVTPRISQVPGDKVVEAHDILLVARIGVIVVGRGVALHVAVVPLQPVDIRQARNPANNNRPPPCHHQKVLMENWKLLLDPSDADVAQAGFPHLLARTLFLVTLYCLIIYTIGSLVLGPLWPCRCVRALAQAETQRAETFEDFLENF